MYLIEDFFLFQGDSLSEDISVVDDAKRLVMCVFFAFDMKNHDSCVTIHLLCWLSVEKL